MDIKIQSIHFDADRKLILFIQEKLSKLTHFYDGIISSEVFLRLDKSDVKTNKVAEVKLSMPGNEIIVKRQCQTFEEAIDTGMDALVRQVKRHKEKVKGI